jgi:tetratricopeptide (TPR) repeat protein
MNEADADRVHERVLTLLRARQYDEAVRLCHECLKTWDESHHEAAWSNLAKVYWRADRKAEAVDAISKSIELSLDDRSHLHTRARLTLELGDLKTSKRDWTRLIDKERLMESEAFVSVALLGRALVHAGLDDRKAALEDLATVADDQVLLVNKRLWSAGELRKTLIAEAN